MRGAVPPLRKCMACEPRSRLNCTPSAFGYQPIAQFVICGARGDSFCLLTEQIVSLLGDSVGR